jgi:Fuc2NAc and GlcNAc transferase
LSPFTLALLSLLLACLLSLVFVALYVRLAKAFGVIDEPNERSAHQWVTPRGAGLSFVVCFLLLCVLPDVAQDEALGRLLSGRMLSGRMLSGQSLAAFLLPVGLLAGIAYLDDLKGLSGAVRFVAYALISVLFLIASPWLELEYSVFSLLSFTLACLFLLWMTNLYNFMDGINGIAGFEAVFVLLSYAVVVFVFNDRILAPAWFVLIGAILGFLFWNFPVGRVFMGDVGSTFLGFLFGVLVVYETLAGFGGAPILILLAYFIADASYTLIYRMLDRQPWLQAHNLHAYQKLARRWQSHPKVVVFIGAINVFWLFPLALFAVQNRELSHVLLFLAYLPLILLMYRVRAGQLER